MISTEISKLGNSAVITFNAEMLSVLGVKAGDTIYVSLANDGSLRITAHDPSMAAALAAGKAVMDENINLLQGLR